MQVLMIIVLLISLANAGVNLILARDTSTQLGNAYQTTTHDQRMDDPVASSRIHTLREQNENHWRHFYISALVAFFSAAVARQASQIEDLKRQLKRTASEPAEKIHKIFCEHCREATPASSSHCIHCGELCRKNTTTPINSSGLRVFGSDH